jgi:hypothetical protein
VEIPLLGLSGVVTLVADAETACVQRRTGEAAAASGAILWGTGNVLQALAGDVCGTWLMLSLNMLAPGGACVMNRLRSHGGRPTKF